MYEVTVMVWAAADLGFTSFACEGRKKQLQNFLSVSKGPGILKTSPGMISLVFTLH